MFKRIITYKGFWKSVALLAVAFMVVFFVIQWAFSGFSSVFLDLSPRTYLALFVGGIVYGCIMAYGKFWAKLRQVDGKNS